MNETTPVTIPTETTVSTSIVSDEAVSNTVTSPAVTSDMREISVGMPETLPRTDSTAEQEENLSETSLNGTDITDISGETVSDVSDTAVSEISEPVTATTEISETITEAPTEIITLPKETTAAETTVVSVTESENRPATPEEQEILAKYVGWGGISNAFDGRKSDWSKEYSELKSLLTDEEFRAAKASTMNAHYTSPTVINAIYSGLQNLGFTGGKILEPAMGIGNFFGAMPESIHNNSEIHGVELDGITGRIAKLLYPFADVQIKGFEKTDFENGSFDVAVSNVPFGGYTVYDKEYNKHNFLIHDYFFAKSLDKVRAGGIVAFVTSMGTLDKENPEVRKYLAERAEFLGAIRLPNNAFKGYGGNCKTFGSSRTLRTVKFK